MGLEALGVVGLGFLTVAGFYVLVIFFRFLSIRRELSCSIAHGPKKPPQYIVKLWGEKNGEPWKELIIKEGKHAKDALQQAAEEFGVVDVCFVVHDWESPTRYSCANGRLKEDGSEMMLEAKLIEEE